MAKPTPGPWEARKFGDTKAHSIYAVGGNHSLATVKDPDPAVQAANARLIATAPKLLLALQGYVKSHDDDEIELALDAGITPSPCDCALCHVARAAMAMAWEDRRE